MEFQDPPRGLIVDLITPLTEKGELDKEALDHLLTKVIGYAHGIFIASPWAGEGKKLGLKVRKGLLEETIALAPTNLRLFVWITGQEEAETRRNLIALQKVTEDRPNDSIIYWADTPLLYHSNRGLPRLYEEFFELAGRPFILINDPSSVAQVRGRARRKNIRTSILKEMARMDYVSGVIFLGTLDRAYNYQKATRKRSNFRIYDGDEARFLEFPSLSGVVSAGANLAPDKWRTITDSSLHLGGAAADYPDSLKQIWDTGQFLHQLRELYSNNPSGIIKAVLAQEGLISNPRSGADDKEIFSAKKIWDLLS